MSSRNLGKNTVCFGEYKCPRCRRQWQSCRAWADFGQKCERCSIGIKAYRLEKLFKYICKNCECTWDWRYVEAGLKCMKCDSATLTKSLDGDKLEDLIYIRAHRLETLNNADKSITDQSREHRSHLCQKCQVMGRCCSGKGTFFMAKLVRSSKSNWTSPKMTPNVFSTPKKTLKRLGI
jgi:hypothetical protein